ncbi:hypothetical protein GW17_00005807 [Ensete ventricosum]|nr:hypothetical protein GW17_00005807 [Ensete ventricosum]
MAATELGAELEWLKATLRESDQYCKDLELAADSTRGELKDLQDLRCWLEDELVGVKAIADYKESRGF